MELFGFCLTLEYGAINRSIYVCIILEINPPFEMFRQWSSFKVGNLVLILEIASFSHRDMMRLFQPFLVD